MVARFALQILIKNNSNMFGGKIMQQPILQTTIAGSLPKPAWLAETTKLWAPWKEVAATLRQALNYVTPAHLQPCTNCGMVPLTRPVALGKLKALVAGAALVRQEWGGG
jgi:methionine synthase II (cobalamin-independent)